MRREEGKGREGSDVKMGFQETDEELSFLPTLSLLSPSCLFSLFLQESKYDRVASKGAERALFVDREKLLPNR